MASVAHLGATPSTSNLTGYTSDSFSPTADDLLVIGVVCQGTIDNAPTLVESAGGGTYTLAGVQAWSGTSSRLFIFVADQLVGASPPARTFTFTLPADAATGCIFLVERVTGMTLAGSSAVVQVNGNKDGASTTPNFTFGAACDTANPTIVFVANGTNPAGLTEPTGWTQLVDTGHNQPATGARAAGRDSGFTGTTVTWGSVSANAWGAIGIELDASGGGGVTVNGTASLSSSASLTALGERTVVGAAALASGAALLTASGVRTVVGSALLNSSGQLTATGLRTVLGAAQLASSALLVATGTSPANTILGTASLSSSASLTALGQREVVGSAQLASGGTLTAAGVRQVLGVSTLISSAILSAQGQREVLGSAILSSSGVLVATGTIAERQDTQVVGVFDLETGTLLASFTVPTRSLDFSSAERSLDVTDAVRSVEYDSPTGASDF